MTTSPEPEQLGLEARMGILLCSLKCRERHQICSISNLDLHVSNDNIRKKSCREVNLLQNSSWVQ